MSDDFLMQRIRARDQAAYRELLRRHLDPVHAYLARMTRSRSDAEDLTQETFLRVWQKASAYKPGRVRPTTWIHRIAHNLCVDAFRRRRGPDSKPVGDPVEEVEDRAADPYLQLAAHRTQERLESALAALPDNQKAAIVLCQIQDFSNGEAADILGVNVRALESLLARARKTLRTTLAESP